MTNPMRRVAALVPLLILIAGLACAQAPEKPFLHPLFTDNMVLQRDIQCPVWGWAKPGEAVKVIVDEKGAEGKADATGKWMVKVGPCPAGGPHDVTVAGAQTVTLKNVLFGDVYICSGQPNMQWGMWGVNNSQEEIAAADHPQIRLYTVPNVVGFEPKETVAGQWQVCSPQTVGGFTAVGYFFGRKLNEELKVPIGLINSSWGGTIAEAWVSAEALKTMPDFAPAVEALQKLVADQKQLQATYDQQMDEWWAKNDPGSAAGASWADPALSTADWKPMTLPTQWEAGGLPNFDGIVWFRKEVEVPQAWQGKEVTLHLGPIDDRDTTWVNGVKVGAVDQYNAPRDYKLPADLLKSGRNVIAARVLDTGGGGGIYGKPEDMKLEAADGATLALPGEWLYVESNPRAKRTPLPQRLENNPNQVTVLYNAMIAPLVPFGIKGAIWYEGESNAGRAEQYARLLPTLIKDWRARFGVGDFPFFIVQLANWLAVDAEPKDDAWPNLRWSQWLTTKALPNVGMACIIDIGDAADIHPKNKQDVGLRLALAALGTTCGRDIEYSGPVYKSMAVEGSNVRLTFDHLGGGLVVKGDKLQGFAIAGEDGKFVWADAAADGDAVVVSSPQVAKPVAVRYAWANNPVCNLYNQAGLPAVPFATDK
ncbi:MAG: 9-O-acetylesterase [Armatimonadetes bacterium]|nr:9-O-acetylesterase [Armatimonadota bacterium]